ncbi:hypothetical protein LTR10_012746 [Elasticomyces elasticus]|uniref:T6SS Phospholipase effector Tle1-like catalytic domain-containing protein n=1 Tax=Exophiala sideris TaxID=1016849 RepID=A0ABR0JR28_9EURO|nr:hypothetical protein LTR10_012746 [Elasticomyces elasticus]KAK5034623.1 hypothetical protein LTR13_006279 [Exophiala sideris]KAK5040055.1 hypothetical protein LTS07_000551 [Exophiala sideris]KAK5068433.1 hypothetical protein LTR69_000552 [Exophiala sideris]KAK5187735.1 hypothetical protein LTR44_000552 [Eurotiomycetes sp. CCFEE 6388]
MSSGPGRPNAGGGPPGSVPKQKGKLGRLGDRIRGRPSASASGTAIRILSPNEPVPIAEQSGMIFTARGREGAMIAILEDGTWNDAVRASPSNAQTNILRLFDCFLGSTSPEDDGKGLEQQYTGKIQIPIYQAGVGNETQGNVVSRNFSNLLGGGIGKGISKNVVYSYVDLCVRYQPGDEVFILGFSRGAFSALSLEAFVADVGIIKIPGSRTPGPGAGQLPAAFRVPWDEVATALFKAWLAFKSSGTSGTWAQTNYPVVPSIQYEVIKAPGVSLVEGVLVYDPVAAYKVPATAIGKPVSALERTLQSVPAQTRILRVAYALNEYRYPFTQIQLNATPNAAHRVAIVWWPGDHGNIGGGSTQSLNISQNTFLFMSQELQAAGFRLHQESISALTVLEVGQRQALQNSYSVKTYGPLGGRNFREPLATHNISRIARMWEEFTLLSEPGIQELLQPIFNPAVAQVNAHQGYEWVTKKSGNRVSEWAGLAGDGNDGLKPAQQVTAGDEAREGQGPPSGFAGQGATVGQDPEQVPNVTGLGPNVPHENPHAPTQLH